MRVSPVCHARWRHPEEAPDALAAAPNIGADEGSTVRRANVATRTDARPQVPHVAPGKPRLLVRERMNSPRDQYEVRLHGLRRMWWCVSRRWLGGE